MVTRTAEGEKVNDQSGGIAVQEVESGWSGLYEWTDDTGRRWSVVVKEVCKGGTEVVLSYTLDTGEEHEVGPVPLSCVTTATVSKGISIRESDLEFQDAQGDVIRVSPLFDGKVTYSVNGLPRSAFTEVELVERESRKPYFRMKSGFVTRRIFLPPYPLSEVLLDPIRRLCEVSGVEHNLGREAPARTAGWERVPVPGTDKVSYWRNAEEKRASFRGPSPEEIALEYKVGVVSNGNGECPFYRCLQQNLRRYDVHEVPVAADGHCQFRSIAYHVYGTVVEHERARLEICKHLEENEEVYAAFCCDWDSFDAYCAAMATAAWGDNITLQAAADLYNKTFNVVTSRQGQGDLRTVRPNSVFNRSAPPTVVWMSYIEKPAMMHYNPAVSRAAEAPLS
ncbi:hypothetical protein DIPPA_31289 [Diplonema papillatum]|nr:hypothetical protein DIPPA_31289 [Diplonema papillatum]